MLFNSFQFLLFFPTVTIFFSFATPVPMAITVTGKLSVLHGVHPRVYRDPGSDNPDRLLRGALDQHAGYFTGEEKGGAHR
ncbi:MAG: hypothetical protein WCG79_04245 [Verrucomicrobiota bacterium]|jgi:hypothetical protein